METLQVVSGSFNSRWDIGYQCTIGSIGCSVWDCQVCPDTVGGGQWFARLTKVKWEKFRVLGEDPVCI